MFWILRRTGAANFFNSLNNNCSFSKGNAGNGNNNGGGSNGGHHNNTQDKYVKRPPRKAYGRLSAEADDVVSLSHKIDDPFDELDNFEMLAPGNGNGNGNINANSHNNGNANANSNDEANDNEHNANLATLNGAGLALLPCNDADCQNNFVVESALCELGLCGVNGNARDYKGKSSKHLSTATSATSSSKEVNENTINRLHALAMADDDDDYDESLTCNVCDRAFHCHRQLASHQQKKRHFGCSGCDSLFPSLMLLEHHKEEFEHWSDDEIGRRICCRRNRCDDDYFTDTDSFISDAESEDLERLL